MVRVVNIIYVVLYITTKVSYKNLKIISHYNVRIACLHILSGIIIYHVVFRIIRQFAMIREKHSITVTV